MQKINKLKYILLGLFIMSTNILALEFDSVEEKDDLEKVVFFKTQDKITNFKVNKSALHDFKEVNKLLDIGNIIEAEKIATKFYYKTNVVSFKNKTVKHMANISLGRVFLEKGERIKWKYMQLQTLNYVLDSKMKKLGTDYFFFLTELGPLILEVKTKKQSLELIKSIKKDIMKFRKSFSNKTIEKLFYKIDYLRYLYVVKYSRSENLENEKFKTADKRLKSLYTYSSIQEAKILFEKAKFYLNKIGDSEKAFKPLKNSYQITKKIIDKEMTNSESSIFLADIYFSLGKLYSTGTKLNKSIEYYNKAEQIYVKTNNFGKALDCKTKEAIVFKILKKFKKALEVNTLQLKMAEDKFNKESEEYAIALVVRGDILSTVDKNEEALKLMEQAKEILSNKYGKFSKEVKIINSSLNFIRLQKEEF